MLDSNKWQQINNDSTGYVGKYRNDEWQKRDEKYGIGQWQMAWLVNDQYLEYIEVCQLYEDAYFYYFEQRPELLEHLLEEASDVYDDSLDNIDSGLDYLKRGAVRTHIQDIVIRNCIQRFGKKFQGSQPIQTRDRLGTHPLSLALSPGQVPFHKPELLSFPDSLEVITKGQWWLPGSVEDFYQRTKRLCVIK
ncbi:MAG: hypothetical protein AUJ28_01125 [Parcubacteria group bacterium CG1_02_37_51]|uniref:Uncharacterized protein n=2 Tax=Candidatus Komeiliibacteriota TaxID=1817908 RepID=A0A2M8DSD0_9BACT|nr:MAG: hypothetical protein AUJ28_01125 [Parcubacteria group bacterium CG1_02_37_51]PIY94913.1 MAG: hypothetical protein COY67_01775 [Candidatus Komeilibacteria bacterium CG_4_10_14_0_8_um_filter_37_78]PJC02268.1 MAG: hypothetical protein CO073_00355 [Candidatus Komeilibacteria bacterium CG_4_9_14_0_8_um_filter_36_9]